MFSTTCSSYSFDDLLVMLGPIQRKADALLEDPLVGSDYLCLLKEDAVSLYRGFSGWQEAQSDDIKPTAIGHVSQEDGSEIAAGYWPGRVDRYFDLHVAAVWNTSRTARVLLINLILNLSEILNDNQNHTREKQDAMCLVEDIISSIPYHLTDDLHIFLSDMGRSAQTMNPGRSVGGLLLMHPMYVVSKVSTVPEEVRKYMKECLVWIGTYMGIGQAATFAKVCDSCVDRRHADLKYRLVVLMESTLLTDA